MVHRFDVAGRPQPVRPRAGCRRAVTLIELLIVVVILAVVAGVAIPRAEPTLADQLHAAARILAADLAYCRRLAVGHGSEYRIHFDWEGNRYEIRHAGDNSELDELPPTPFREADDPPDRQIVYLDRLPGVEGRVRLAGAVQGDAGTPVDHVQFESTGETYRSGETRIILAAGSGTEERSLTVRVNGVTGLATVEK